MNFVQRKISIFVKDHGKTYLIDDILKDCAQEELKSPKCVRKAILPEYDIGVTNQYWCSQNRE